MSEYFFLNKINLFIKFLNLFLKMIFFIFFLKKKKKIIYSIYFNINS
jgi:hypothetical protein